MRIILADHHILFREGLAGLLSADPEIEVVGITGSSSETIEKTLALLPDILLLDLTLPDGGGLDVLKTTYLRCPDVKTIILTVQFTDDLLLSAVQNGAKGYLLKDIPAGTLLESLKAVLRDETAFTRSMTRRIIDEIARKNLTVEQSYGFEQLTDREMEVLEEICNGSSNQEIAKHFSISENTVKAHVRKILSKLNLQNRREAKRLAIQHGFVHLQQTNPQRIG
jgi:DNA-binding NarL/FixJ family response regulator